MPIGKKFCKMFRSIKIHFIFFVELMLLCCNIFYWGAQKEGYYIDELWSYGLSNSYYMPFLQEQEYYMNCWHEPEFYKAYLTVSDEEVFSYASVYDNQVHDVHPPLYYMLLHTVCSVFKGYFSKWFGLSINVIFFIGTIWLLYEISGMMFGADNYARLIPSAIYGISGWAISSALYIRMYMMLIFWCLLFVYLTFCLMNDQQKKIKIFVKLMAVTAAGFLTQYYFLIFTFFISGGYVLYRMYQKQYKDIISFASCVIAGIGIGIIIFPASLHHIFIGEKGQESLGNTFRGIKMFLSRFTQYEEIIGEGIFLQKRELECTVIGIIFISIAILLIRLMQRHPNEKGEFIFNARFGILTTTFWGYFFLIVQISTDIVDRYQFIIHPIGILLSVCVILQFFQLIKKEKWIWLPAVLFIFFCIWHYSDKTIHYIYPGYESAMQTLATTYKDIPEIYITAGDHLVINNCLFLSQQEMTYPISADDLEKLPEIYKKIKKDQLILYVDIYFNENQVAEEIAELLDYSSYSLLYNNTFSKIYCLSR